MAGQTMTQSGGVASSKPMPTSQEITKEVNVTAQVDKVGSKIGRDIESMMGEGGKIKQTDNVLSIDAAKRVAFDSQNQLAKARAVIDNNTNYDDPASVREAKDLNTYAYLAAGRKTFPENEDAQREFDRLYTDSAGVSTAETNVALDKEAMKLDDDIQFKAVPQKIGENLNSGIILISDTLHSSAESMSRNGYTLGESYLAIAVQSTTSFDSKTHDNPNKLLTSVGYDEKQGWTSDIAEKLFAKSFGAYGKLKDGEVVWEKKLTEKAKAEILSSWENFDNQMSSGKGTTLDPFSKIKKDVNKTSSDASGDYQSSKMLTEEYDRRYQEQFKIRKTQPSTESHRLKMDMSLESLKDEIILTKIVEADLGLGGEMDGDKALSYYRDGKPVTYTNSRGVKTSYKIPASRYKSAANSFMNKHSNTALGMELKTSDDVKKFQSHVTAVLRLQGVTGIKPTIYTKYANTLDKGTVGVKFENVNDFQQLTAYNDVVLEWDKNNEVLREVNNEMKDTMASTRLTDAQKISNNSITIQTERNSQARAMQSTQITTIIKDVIDKEKKGKGLFTNDSTMHPSVNISIKKAIYAGKKQNVAESEVDTYLDRTVDIGSITKFGDKDERIIKPRMMTNNDVKKSISALYKDYHADKNSFKKYSEGDAAFHQDFKNGDFVIIVYDKKSGNKLGEINSTRGYELATQGE